MKRNFMVCSAVLLILALAILSGCTGKSAKKGVSSTSKKQYLVIFSQCNNAEPYRAAQNALMTKLFSKQKDVKLVITDAQQDNAKQIAQIETAIRQKPDLLIVAPNERAPLTRVMGQAISAKIPVICLERDIAEPNYTTFIRCDNRKIGQMAGQFIVDKLTEKYGEPKGRIVELAGLKGVEAEINRQGGAHDVFKKYPKIEVVGEAVADWLQSKAKDRMTEILSAQSQIDCVYGHNDPMAVGAYLAAKDKNREKEMFFVGVDGLGGEAGGIKKVMDGVLSATFIYPPCVDKAVEVGSKIMRDPSFKPQKTYVMDSVMITRKNAAEMYKKCSN